MYATLRILHAAAIALTAAVLAACGSGDADTRGQVVSVTQTSTIGKAVVDGLVATQSGLDALIGRRAACGVSLQKIVYQTRGPRGEDARASAGLLIPTGCPGPHPTLVYHHGTTVIRSFSAADVNNGETALMLSMFAAQGYAVVMPDYHGYGESSLGYHPYLHADNTAEVSIDALRAARRVLSDKGVASSGKLFLTGYSQGGHAAAATQRALERDHADEFTVTASVPMAGPYALSQTLLAGLENPGQGATVFTPMIFVGYQKAYGDIYSQPEDAFQQPWAAGIETLIPGALSFTQLITTGKLPLAISGPGGLLTDGFIDGFRGSPDHPARRRAAQNDLLDWKPRAMTALCAGSRDPVVSFANLTIAAASFAARGATVAQIDVEQVQAFRTTIDAQVASAPDLSTYHGGIVPPLCASVAKNQIFDPLR